MRGADPFSGSSPPEAPVIRSRWLRALAAVPLLAACGDEPPPSSQVPTWHADVAPVVVARCGGCHTEGGIAPFALDDYATAQSFREVMLGAVDEGTMPPWGAVETDECTPPKPWRHDSRLTDEERATLEAWVAAGGPEGDPATAAPVARGQGLELVDPSLRVMPRAPFTTEGDRDQYHCQVLDPGLDRDVWITGAQVVPGDPRVVHHALLYIDADASSEELAGEDGQYPCFGGAMTGPGDDLLWVWTPGQLPMETPSEVAVRLPAGARIVASIHYYPVPGEAVTDSTGVDLRVQDTPPRYESQVALLGNRRGPAPGDPERGLLPGPSDPADGPAFFIPAGASEHTETMALQMPAGLGVARVWAVGTHMHYVGTDMIIEVEHAEPAPGEPPRECLVHTPQWDFNWQMIYAYDAPIDALPQIRGGDVVHLRCTYDNTPDNPGVRLLMEEEGLEAPIDVTLGEQTADEMCLAMVGFLREAG